MTDKAKNPGETIDAEAVPVDHEERGREIARAETGAVIDANSVAGVELQAQRIEKYMEVQGRIRRACIKMTNIHDWVDEDGKPYLMWTGAAKIAAAYGVSYDTPRFIEKPMHDEKGDYIIFESHSLIRWQGRSVPEIGTATTRDDLLATRWRDGQGGKKEKYYLPISELDINDIKKKALTNMLNRGLKSLLGMSFSWDEISKATNGEITAATCASVKHGKGTQGGKTDTNAGTAADRAKVWTMLLEICSGDEAAAQARLKKLTTFKGRDGEVPGKTDIKAVSEAQMKFLTPAVEKEHKAMVESMGKKPADPAEPKE